MTAPDGTLMYADRAEHRKLNPIAPQMAFVGTDGTVLARAEFDGHSTFHGGGRILGTTEQGWNLAPGARLLDANDRPLGDLVYEQPPTWTARGRPTEAMPAPYRWIATDGTQLAERRDGVLHLDDRVTGAWRAIIIGSYLAAAFEFHLPINEGEASETAPELYPGHAGLHAAYDEFQRNFMMEYRRPIQTPFGGPTFRADVQRDQLEHSFKLFFPVVVAVVVIVSVIRYLT